MKLVILHRKIKPLWLWSSAKTTPSSSGTLPVGQEDLLVHGVETMTVDIEDFRETSDYHSYRLGNRTPYLDHHTDQELRKLKRQIDSIYLSLRIFDRKDIIKTFGFIATIRNYFDDRNMPDALANRPLGFFMSEADQTAYHIVVHPGTEHSIRFSPTWKLVFQTFLSRLVTDDLLGQEQKAVMKPKIKPESLLASICRNVFTKREMVNYLSRNFQMPQDPCSGTSFEALDRRFSMTWTTWSLIPWIPANKQVYVKHRGLWRLWGSLRVKDSNPFTYSQTTRKHEGFWESRILSGRGTPSTYRQVERFNCLIVGMIRCCIPDNPQKLYEFAGQIHKLHVHCATGIRPLELDVFRTPPEFTLHENIDDSEI